MSTSNDDVERVARAIHLDEYPLGEWEHVRAEHRAKWRAMARTCVSVAMWGDFFDAAKRLAHWDDVDNKRQTQPFDKQTPAAQRLWLRRAEVGFAALRGFPIPPRQARAASVFKTTPGELDDGA